MKVFLTRYGFRIVVALILLYKFAQFENPLQEVVFISLALCIMGVLVFVHELGHALIFAWRGIGINSFSVGFGEFIVSFIWGETKIGIAWIPIGGYVRVVNTETLSSFSVNEIEEIRDRYPKRFKMLNDPSRYLENVSGFDRILAYAAGPIASYLLGIIATFSIFAFVGIPDQINPFHPKVEVVDVQKGTEAENYGVQKGDTIRAIDGKPMLTFPNIRLGKENVKLPIVIFRNEEFFKVLEINAAEINIDVVSSTVNVSGLLIEKQKMTWVKVSPITALYRAVILNTKMFMLGLISPLILGWLFFVKLQYKLLVQSGGAISVISLISDSLGGSVATVVLISAVLSSSIGGLNSFPGCLGFKKSFPLLDGGHILDELCQYLFGKNSSVFLWCSRILTPIMILILLIMLLDFVLAIFR